MEDNENSNTKTGVRESIDELCQDNYDLLKDEIVSAIVEGVEKGLEEGVENGILSGLNECFEIEFLNVRNARIKTIEEILEETASETAKDQVKERIKKETCPILKQRGDRLCDRILIEIKSEEEEVIEADFDLIRALNIEKICKDKAEEIKQEIEKKLPQNFISLALFNGMLEAISECMAENVESCTEKIREVARQNRSV